jgi:hypothetical protein
MAKVITFPSNHPPRNPANSAAIAFRRAFIPYAIAEIKAWHAQMQHDYLGKLPFIVPYHWTAQRIVDIANGNHKPVYPGKITCVSNVRTG